MCARAAKLGTLFAIRNGSDENAGIRDDTHSTDLFRRVVAAEANA
jgi:hypothetical protein